MEERINRLKIKSIELRKHVLEMIYRSKTGHLGGDFSVMDSLVALYDYMDISPENFDSVDRDHFILSKGHCVEALYSVLADKGFLKIEDVIEQYSQFGSAYIGHPSNTIPGIEMNSGSLGHGLSICVGMAIAGKKTGRSYRVYTVLGDGEIAEGSVWEAAMAASNYRLDNLCAILDRNKLQISGCTESVMKQESVEKRFESFGWRVITVSKGNDPGEILHALSEAEEIFGSPVLIIAETKKGYGSEICENKAGWHHKVPDEAEYTQIMKDLDSRKEELLNEQNHQSSGNV